MEFQYADLTRIYSFLKRKKNESKIKIVYGASVFYALGTFWWVNPIM